MYQESEIVDLVMAAFLTPVIAIGLRSIEVAGKRWFVASYIAIIAAFVLTVAEGYTAPVLLNNLEHVAYAASGVMLVMGSRQAMREMRRRVEAL